MLRDERVFLLRAHNCRRAATASSTRAVAPTLPHGFSLPRLHPCVGVSPLLAGLDNLRKAISLPNYYAVAESKIVAMFKGSHAMLAYMVALPLRGFSTTAQADDGESFFKKHPVPEAAMKLSQVLEKIRSKAAWLERDGEALAKFFA